MIYNTRRDIIATKSDVSQVWQCAPAGSPLQQHEVHHSSLCLRRRTGRTDPATYTTYYAPSRSLLLLTMLLLQQLHLLQRRSFQHTLDWLLLCFSLLCKTSCLHCLFQTPKRTVVSNVHPPDTATNYNFATSTQASTFLLTSLLLLVLGFGFQKPFIDYLP